ncbi:hypothetical protein PRI8871_02355 [Pseudoprimorskyibacter insulae]|uniref:DUF5333 domain-containing protein n=2 Tax=Pseudoprimorskyibacter insulae TaxID=1695997 RepID=A0A2R8AWX4_9RHOB|nr:hypothetical protein PRI8871_02355 [Pseudoprimorskyibacter insulae]
MMKPFALALTLIASSASALVPLREVKEIDHNMLWVAIAIEISDKCGSIAPRTLKGYAFLSSLKDKARSLGYSDDEIKTYVSSADEKARIRKLGEAYVKSKGLDPRSAEDLCTLGQAEIARSSQIGVLLRAK